MLILLAFDLPIYCWIGLTEDLSENVDDSGNLQQRRLRQLLLCEPDPNVLIGTGMSMQVRPLKCFECR